MIPFDQKYICFDTESSGLNLKYSKPWQLSWIECEGQRIVDIQDRFIDWPNLVVPEEAARVNGFNRKTYDAKKEDISGVWEDFSALLFNPEYIIVGQNLFNFDIFMLKVIADKLEIKLDYSFLENIYDTRALAMAIRENLRRPANDSDLLPWQMKIIGDRSLKSKVSQEQLLKFFSIDYDPEKLHDGLYDSTKTFEIFLACKKTLKL